MAKGDPWFVYQRTTGRITGRPANLKGWLSLLAILLVTTALAAPAMAWLIRAGHPIIGALVLTAILLCGLFLLFRLMLAKGRDVTRM